MFIQGVKAKMADIDGDSRNDPGRASIDLDQEAPDVAPVFCVPDVLQGAHCARRSKRAGPQHATFNFDDRIELSARRCGS
jgi:hypothetical protein